MADVVLIREPRDWGARLDDSSGTSLVFDAIVSESPAETAEVPEYALEDGAPIAEHYRRKPLELTLVVEQTDTPIWIDDPPPNRSISAYEALRSMMDRAETMTVTTGLRVYTDLVITSLTPRSDFDTGQSIEFTLTLRQIRRVAPAYIRIPEEWLAADAADAASEADRGPAGGTEGEERHHSILYDLLGLGDEEEAVPE